MPNKNDKSISKYGYPDNCNKVILFISFCFFWIFSSVFLISFFAFSFFIISALLFDLILSKSVFTNRSNCKSQLIGQGVKLTILYN